MLLFFKVLMILRLTACASKWKNLSPISFTKNAGGIAFSPDD